MNKQKYLAELQRLLVFMTEEDRELTVRRFGEIFDAAGQEGEEDITASLGTPTKAAISLSRGYEPGGAAAKLPPVPASPEPEPEPEPAPAMPKKQRDLWIDLPDFEPPEPAASRTGKPAPAPAGRTAAPVKKTETPVRAARREEPYPDPEDPDDWPELPTRGELEPVTVYERSVPLGLGVPLFIVLLLALVIPLMLVCVALTLVFLAPGAAMAFGAYLVFVGGLWCLSIVADAILLFGAALIVLALALFLLWIGLWLAVGIWKLWGRATAWMTGELLGRRVTEYE